MGLFSKADPGRFPYKSGFNLGYEKDMDIEIGKLNILSAEFICSGDIVHLGENLLLRFQAQIAPFFTPMVATVRAWFEPLRLLDDNTEWIITGSKNGKLVRDEHGDEVDLPTFDKLFDYDNSSVTGHHKLKVGGVVEQMFGLPAKKASGGSFVDIDYSSIADDKIIPALYWVKGYYRLWFDYYRDENLFDYDDFEDWWTAILTEGKIGQQDLLPVNWKKDYLTSMLYAQQKGISPVLNPFINNPQNNLPLTIIDTHTGSASNPGKVGDYFDLGKDKVGIFNDKYLGTLGDDTAENLIDIQAGNIIPNISAEGKNSSLFPNITLNQFGTSKDTLATVLGGFNVSELRLLFAQQKIFERLMRCGSRYVEYLMSNFGIAPADETLQRVQYLGGFKQSVVTSEVLQTGTDSSNPVGTQRGHSISAGGNSLGTHKFKEFGLLFVTLSVMPKAQYTQGCSRKYGLVERFDFPNPSFQFLSEDEVINGEVFIDTDTDADGNNMNNKTMGFQEMYAWLKSNRDMITGNLRTTESYWVMPRQFSTRPQLNEQFLTSVADSNNFSSPFAVTDKPPIICRAGNSCFMWRNFAKYGTPGLLDHY